MLVYHCALYFAITVFILTELNLLQVALLGLDILSLLVERLQGDFQPYYNLSKTVFCWQFLSVN